jgi:hypothetical protein
MKITYKVGLAIVTSLAVGTAVQGLHAQAKPSSDKEKIANAMTAAPPVVSRNASVVEMNEDGSMKVLRKGSGEWTCVPDDPSTPGNDPMCLDLTQWNGCTPMRPSQPRPIRSGLSTCLKEDGTSATPTRSRPNPKAEKQRLLDRT